MPALKTYDLFISHAWRHCDHYNRLVNLITQATNFKFRNYSVPRHDPVIDPSSPVGKRTLRRELDQQIKPVNCVLVCCGMYAAYGEWIQTEVDIARSYGKPIVGVIPQGQTRIPQSVSAVADEMVRWNTASIVEAIRNNSI